ncbi:hypothetical protein LOD99_3784 [Oopsacas minuta]|uniref:ATPase AAA-type core domain-containing protein n=1 Tax=Oopsacas minuta TaxID=111878 RepID=A0AAV7JXP8_9METZ|nr:hypothetical protein LOD99_3784 [Oopsacas minuta]
MNSSERTPRKKHKRKESQNTPHDISTPSVLKITQTNVVDLPTQRDYFFANIFTLKQHGILIGQPFLITPIDKPIGQSIQFVCQPWPLESINRDCVSLTQSKLELLGIVEGDLVRIEKINFGIENANSVQMKCLSEKSDVFDKSTCGYLATQLHGKYVFIGAKFSVSYLCCDVILEAIHIEPIKGENLKDELSKISLFDTSDDDATILTPAKSGTNMPAVYRISNKTVLKIEISSKIGSSEDIIQPIGTKLDELAGLEKQAKEIQDIIELSIATDKGYRNFRMNIPSGLLVCGNVGVGKTTLLKGLARQFQEKANVRYIQIESILANEGNYFQIFLCV